MQQSGSFIILKRVRYSEADLILTAISVKGEKKSFLARNALKSRKRFGGGVLEPTHYVKLTYLDKSETNHLHVLEEAQLINDFYNLRKNYDLLELSLQAVDCIYKVSQEGDPRSESLYNLLGHFLKNLSKDHFNYENDLPILKLQFYLKFLAEQGVLQTQIWMQPYLKTNLSEHLNLYPLIEKDKKQIPFVENQIKHYLQHANL